MLGKRFKIYHYKPMVEKDKIHPVPMLVSTPLINGYEVADLQPDRSLVRNFLREGIDVYMINWGYPKRCDRFNTVDDYVTDFTRRHRRPGSGTRQRR